MAVRRDVRLVEISIESAKHCATYASGNAVLCELELGKPTLERPDAEDNGR
jgi:hypothetical protein